MAVDSIALCVYHLTSVNQTKNSHATTLNGKKIRISNLMRCVEIIDFDDDNSINVTRRERDEERCENCEASSNYVLVQLLTYHIIIGAN